MSQILLFGAGATGSRIARQLCSTGDVDRLEIRDPNISRSQLLVNTLGRGVEIGEERSIDSRMDLVIVASPPGTQAGLARRAVKAGVPVITTSNQTAEVRRLLELDSEARIHRAPLVVGAGFMPGLSCLLARHAAWEFDEVDEVHVAKAGSGGPACARQHQRALGTIGVDWRDGEWTRRAGGSGRELVWFPEPVGGRDCYRAALPDALLLAPEFPSVQRVTARQAATRRDRVSAPFPMLRRPHPEGGIGAVRVELRGRIGRERRVVAFGAVERPAIAAGAMASAVALRVLDGSFAPGAAGLAAVNDTVALLRILAERGVKPVRFEGVSTFV